MKTPTKKEILSQNKLEFYRQIKKYQSEFKPSKEIEGYASTSIIGEKNYPNLKVYNVSNEDKNNSFFNTNKIVKQTYKDIIKLKAKNILGSTNNIYIKKINTKILEELNDIYKSKKEVQFISKFDKELKFNKPIINKLSGVLGTKNELLTVQTNDNPTTSKKLEKYTAGDTKAKEAIINLYEKQINESQIINLLSLGNFGLTLNKKMVPTKWTITAYDQTIEKYLYSQFVKYNPISNYEIYYYKDKGNAFLITLLPDTFSGEVIEADENAKFEARDHVGFNNKLNKKEPDTSGGFYATKVGIFELLKQRKKQAGFISVRIIDNYEIHLGVVLVRECVRDAMKNKIFESSDFKEITDYMKRFYPKHYKRFITSKVLIEQKKQRKLREFF